MDRPASFPSALTRLETALERLESLAVGGQSAQSGGQQESAALAALEAERDLLQLRHRRLIQSTERAITDLDALIMSRS